MRGTTSELPAVKERKRFASPARTPQALAWHEGQLWMGSRDLRRIYALDPTTGKVRAEMEAPGIPWAAVSTGDELRFTIGEGAEDDRYIHRLKPGSGFVPNERITCPDFTGSYLSHDGHDLYLSQWYKGRILKLDANGNVQRTIEVGAEICGHTFVDGMLYVIRGTEQDGEHWTLVRLDPRDDNPSVEEIARLPFASRSLTHDGEQFWSNFRANDEIIAFALP